MMVFEEGGGEGADAADLVGGGDAADGVGAGAEVLGDGADAGRGEADVEDGVFESDGYVGEGGHEPD